MSNSLIIFTDGGSRGNPGKSGVGVFVKNEKNEELVSISKFLGVKTNNEAEYLAFIESLLWLRDDYFQSSHEQKSKVEISWFLDSKLVVEQLNKRWKIKEDRLKNLASKCWALMDQISSKNALSWKISHVERSQNSVADLLANKAMDSQK